MFQRTTAINKILKMKAAKKVIQGGTSSGKTYGIIPILIDKATKTPKLKITVVAETIPAVKDGTVDIFKQIMDETGRWRESAWISNPMEYTFVNGSRIQFKAFETFGKAKASGKRDILFLNEANHIPYTIADALMIRSKETYIDYNPDAAFWATEEVLKEPNSEFLLLIYKDNEGLPSETLEDLLIKKSKAFYNIDLPDDELLKPENIKNNFFSNWWKVYGLGIEGGLQGVVFQNWTTYKELPSSFLYKLFVVDWGGNDPTTLTELNIDSGNKRLYIKQIVYTPLILNSKLIEKIQEVNPDNRFVICDSARKDKIFELQMAKIKAFGGPKGAGSIIEGIDLLQDFEIFIHENSADAIREFSNHKWVVDKKTGKMLNVPEDKDNHIIDPTTYGIRFYKRNINPK